MLSIGSRPNPLAVRSAAVDQLLQDGSVVIPVEILIQMGNLTEEDYEVWRFGRIPYLERAIKCKLSKANRILRILRLYAEDRGGFARRALSTRSGAKG